MKSIPAKPIMVCLVGTFKFLDSPTRHLYKELKEVRVMKPYRMINMALAILLPIFLIYTGMPIEKLANITQTIMNGVLAFVYPAIIFFKFLLKFLYFLLFLKFLLLLNQNIPHIHIFHHTTQS